MTGFYQSYEAELDYLRQAMGRFEADHPARAEVLGVSGGTSDDPHIRRLLDGVALLAARLHRRLDGALPEIAAELLAMIAPSLLMDAPSFAALALDPGDDPSEARRLPAGERIVFDDPRLGEVIFVAARDTALLPFRVTASYRRAPFDFDRPAAMGEATSCLELTFAPDAPDTEVAIPGGRLDLWLAAARTRNAGLMEALTGRLVGAAWGGEGGTLGRWSRPTAIRGTADPDFGVLPPFFGQPAGLETLREGLAYPGKAAFFTLRDLPQAAFRSGAEARRLRLYLAEGSDAPFAQLAPDDLRLNVVPAVNLFEEPSEPVEYDFRRDGLELVPSGADGAVRQILAVTGLAALTPEGETPLPPASDGLLGGSGGGGGTTATGWPRWQVARRAGPPRPDVAEILIASPAGEAAEPLPLVARLLCSGGAAVAGLPVGSRGTDRAGAAFALLTEPTATQPARDLDGSLWDLLSALQSSHATLFESADPVAALRRLVVLASGAGRTDTAAAIRDVRLRRSVAPLKLGGRPLLAAGTSVEIVVDAARLGMERQAFADLMRRFLTSFCSYDRFIEVSVRQQGEERPFASFPKDHGSRPCA